MTRSFVGLLLAISVAAAPPSSVAHASAPAADAAYEQGKAALKAGDTAGAMTAFKTGLALAGDDEGLAWQFMLALALTYDKAGKPGYAIETYQRLLEQTEAHGAVLSPKWKNRRTLIAQDIKKLEAKVKGTHGYVTVVTEPAGARVFVGGVQAGAEGAATSPTGFYFPAGEHVISVHLDGYAEADKAITLGAGKVRPIRFELSPATEPAPVEPAVVPAAEPAPVEALDSAALFSDDVVITATEEADSGGLGPWLVLGAGGAVAIAAAVSAGLGAAARSDWGDYAAALRSAGEPGEGDHLQASDTVWQEHADAVANHDVMTGALAGIAAATVAGGLLWLALGGDDEAPADTPALTLTPTAGGALGHVSWGF